MRQVGHPARSPVLLFNRFLNSVDERVCWVLSGFEGQGWQRHVGCDRIGRVCALSWGGGCSSWVPRTSVPCLQLQHQLPFWHNHLAVQA